MSDQTLIEKIQSLPPDLVEEVEGFVDFLRMREQHHTLVDAAARLSEPSFREIWDNSDPPGVSDSALCRVCLRAGETA